MQIGMVVAHEPPVRALHVVLARAEWQPERAISAYASSVELDGGDHWPTIRRVVCDSIASALSAGEKLGGAEGFVDERTSRGTHRNTKAYDGVAEFFEHGKPLHDSAAQRTTVDLAALRKRGAIEFDGRDESARKEDAVDAPVRLCEFEGSSRRVSMDHAEQITERRRLEAPRKLHFAVVSTLR